MVSRIKTIKNISVAVGFGGKTRAHADALWQVADGVIVGSYLVWAVADLADPVLVISGLVGEFA